VSPHEPPIGASTAEAAGDGAQKAQQIVLTEAVVAETEPKPRKKRWHEKPNNWIRLVTLLFVGGYTVLTYCSLQTSRESFTAVQRAFVGISEVKVERAKVFGFDGWLITPVIKNSGNTQTKGLHSLTIEACLGGGIIIGGTESNCSAMERRATGPIDPEDSFRTPFAKIRILPILPQATIPGGAAFITPERIKNIANRGEPGYLYGVIHYRDVFAGTPDHITKYCFEFDGGVTLTDAEPKPVYGYCPHWNCADDECKADREEYESEFAALPNGKKMLEIQRGWVRGGSPKPLGTPSQ
jgi:hypothetical protein